MRLYEAIVLSTLLYSAEVWPLTATLTKRLMGITWEEAEVAAQNRSEWRQSVAQCIHLDAG